MMPPPPRSTLFPYTTLFRSCKGTDFKRCKFFIARGKLKRSEEHTSELQSRENLVCRLLLEKKKLSPLLVEQLVDVVHNLHAQDVTFVVVEQSVNTARTTADRAYFLEKVLISL